MSIDEAVLPGDGEDEEDDFGYPKPPACPDCGSLRWTVIEVSTTYRPIEVGWAGEPFEVGFPTPRGWQDIEPGRAYAFVKRWRQERTLPSAPYTDAVCHKSHHHPDLAQAIIDSVEDADSWIDPSEYDNE